MHNSCIISCRSSRTNLVIPYSLPSVGHLAVGARAALAELPVFTPTPGTASIGLDLLASAALAQPSSLDTLATPYPSQASPNPSLTVPGPFNPAASLATRVTKRILDLEFVEMSEVTMDLTPEHVPGRPPPPGRPPIMDVSQWVERYSLMAAVIATRFPHKAPELFAYQATIIRAERNYEAGRWVAYDRQFRREALARKDLNWSTPDPRLYSEAFTGRARSIPRCDYCLQDDHSSQRCPQNPDQPWVTWLPGATSWQGTRIPPSGRPTHRSSELCRRFNEGRCKLASCCYTHSCRTCGGTHPAISCRQGYQRPRSPLRVPATQGQGMWPPARR